MKYVTRKKRAGGPILPPVVFDFAAGGFLEILEAPVVFAAGGLKTTGGKYQPKAGFFLRYHLSFLNFIRWFLVHIVFLFQPVVFSLLVLFQTVVFTSFFFISTDGFYFKFFLPIFMGGYMKIVIFTI